MDAEARGSGEERVKVLVASLATLLGFKAGHRLGVTLWSISRTTGPRELMRAGSVTSKPTVLTRLPPTFRNYQLPNQVSLEGVHIPFSLHCTFPFLLCCISLSSLLSTYLFNRAIFDMRV